MSRATIYSGDCLASLRSIPNGAARCCVTSPPYWGLRDYGTGKWEGGDAGCDHLGPPKASTKSGLKNDGRPPESVGQNEYERSATVPFRSSCGKCGATRTDDQIGLESTPELYVARMVEVFREVRRVLADDGTLWLNLGDSYAADRGGTHPPAETLGGGTGGYGENGERVNRSRKDGYNPSRNALAIGLKHKDLVGIPWRVAFALQAGGWYLRSDIIWAKPNPMPESVRDRPTKSHEYLFLLSKQERYYYDAAAIAEPSIHAGAVVKNDNGKNGQMGEYGATRGGSLRAEGVTVGDTRNARSVWTIATRPYPEAHFATFPEELPRRCILAGSAPGDTILDPFGGSGTTGAVAIGIGRPSILCELNPDYIALARQRIGPMFCDVL